MSLLTFAKTALGSMVKQPVTVCYPHEKLTAPERLRGHIVNDMDVCICCPFSVSSLAAELQLVHWWVVILLNAEPLVDSGLRMLWRESTTTSFN